METLIQTLEKQETICQFTSFDLDTAWRIGLSLREAAIRVKANVLLDITANGLPLFVCSVGSPTPHNKTWVSRKRNTVMEFWKSSYLVAQEIAKSDKNLTNRGLSETDIALAGGGFPIRVQGLGVIGTIVCSGLPQEEDHQLIVDAIAKELGVNAPSILS